MIKIIDSRGDTIQSSLMKQWKPYAIQQNKVLVKVPSMTVEYRIRESIDPLLAEQKKALNNYALEFVFEVEEVQEDMADERKIPQHIRDFQKLLSDYPEVKNLKDYFGLNPVEL